MKNEISAALPDFPIKSLTKIAEGKAAEIYLANDEIILKIPFTAAGSNDIVLEHAVLSALYGKVEVAIPQPLFLTTLSDGRQVLGESRVPGQPFSQEIYESFTQAEKNIIFAQMGEIFRQIHSVDAPVPGLTVWTPQANLEDFYGFYTPAVKNALPDALQLQMEQIIADFRAAMEHIPTVLCHGDMHFENFNYDPGTKRLCGLLDFGIACYNDPLNDMRYFWSDAVEIMLRSYGGIGESAAARHLFYCVHNLTEEAHGNPTRAETQGFGARESIAVLTAAMNQKRLATV